MRLGYFSMPVHPIGRDWSQTLREDREAIILAEQVMPRVNAAIGKPVVSAAE